MEGLPRTSMISLDLKESNDAPEFSPLYNYIESHYNERSSSYKDAFKEFQNLRQASISGTESLTYLTNMKRYFCQLQLFKQRFPLSKDGNCSVTWSWEDSHSNSAVSINDIRLEEASILYNIGCLHCNLGAIEKRGDLDSTKIACTHFQCAAWAFQTVLEQYTPLPSADLECDVLRYLNLLMLAQAHECVLEKSMVDQRRAAISAKIAFQISDLYKQCQGLLQSENIGYTVNSKQYKLWNRTCALKENLYHCLSYFYMAIGAEDGHKYGEIIAWLKLAKEKLEKCGKSLKELKSSQADDTIKFVHDVVNGKFESAKKDNDFIYYEKVPEPEMLPSIKGALLLKGIGFDFNDPGICGQDIFKTLIPMETHISSSIYSEKKAELLRVLQAEVEAKDSEIDQFLTNMHWTSDTFSLEDSKVPQEFFNCAAYIASNTDEITNIKRIMQDISSISIEVEESLETLSNQMRSVQIDKSSTTWKNHESEYRDFITNFEDAKESNNQLRDAFSCTLSDFVFVNQSIEKAIEKLPSLRTMSDNTEAVKSFDECKRLMAKIEEMKTQRASLILQLKTDMMADDITQRLLGCKLDSEQNKIIDESLKKYDETIGYLRQNMAAQPKIVDAVVDHNAKIADINATIMDLKKERHTAIDHVVKSFHNYKCLVNKGEEAINFYRGLGDNIIKFQRTIQSLLPLPPIVTETKQPVVAETPPNVINNPLPDLINKPVVSPLNETMENFAYYSFPTLPTTNPQPPRLKDYLKVRKGRHSLPSSVDTSALCNVDQNQEKVSNPVLNTNQYPYMPWGYYGPPCQGIYNSNYAVSRPRDTGSEFRITQNIQLPAASSEVGCSVYPNYSSLPRPNYSQPSLTSTTCNLTASIDNLSSTGLPMPSNQFTIPYQQQQFYNPNVISMAYSSGRSSISLHEQPYQYSNKENQQYQSHLPNQNPSSIYQQNMHYNDLVAENQPSYYIQSHQGTQHNQGIYPNSQPYYASSLHIEQAYSSNLSGQFDTKPSTTDSNFQGTSQQNPGSYYSSFNNTVSGNLPQNYQSNSRVSAIITNPQVTQQNPQYYPNNDIQSLSQHFPTSQSYYSTNINAAANVQPNYSITSNNQAVMSNMTFYDNSMRANTSISSPQQHPFTKESLNSFSNTMQPVSQNMVIQPSQSSPNSKLTNSNTDLLSSSPTNCPSSDNSRAILEPTVLTMQELEDQKEEKRKQIYRKQSSGSNNPLNDNLVLNKFIADAERFMKRALEILDTSSTKGLEQHWTLLVNKERMLPKKSSAIAKCSPMKNRIQDSIPYDENRVVIKEGKDDYVNASHISLQNIDECLPRFITFQSPLSNTVTEFWTAVFEQGCELLVQLAQPCSKDDTSKARVVSCWPDTKGQTLAVGVRFEISVQSLKEKNGWSERILLVKHLKSNQSRSIWHFQVHNVSNKLPKSHEEFLTFVTELCGYYRQQRSLTKPIGISCMNGSSVCGVMILLTTALTIMDITGIFPDIDSILLSMWSQRKSLLDDKHQLAFVYKTISKASSDMLSKRNIVIGPGRVASSSHTTINEPHSSSTNVPSTPHTTTSILDSLFTTQHLQLSELTSAISKWTVKVDDKIEDIPIKDDIDITPIKTDFKQSTMIKVDADSKKLKDIQLPSNLKHLQDPATIDFTPTPSDKRKITKKEFEQKINKSYVKPAAIDSGPNNDPLRSLDPIYNNQ